MAAGKTHELILYIASKLALRSNYGSTLLNKALYFSDSIAYMKLGQPISSFKYIKQNFGPTPDPAQFLKIRDKLVKVGDLEISSMEYFGRLQKKVIAKRQPNVSVFSVEEIVIVDDVLNQIEHMSGTDISDLSHQFPAWKVADDKEELPFFTFLLSSKSPSPDDILWAKQELKRVRD
jgi:hypothetical protein